MSKRTIYDAVRMTRDEVAMAFDRGEYAKIAGHIASLEHENANLKRDVQSLRTALKHRDDKIRKLGGWSPKGT